MHADFWNTWNQARLEQLVSNCVNAGKKCDYDDVTRSPSPVGPPGTRSTDHGTDDHRADHHLNRQPLNRRRPSRRDRPRRRPAPPSRTPRIPRGDELLANPNFERGIAGWEAEDGTLAGRTPLAHSGGFAAVLIRADLGRDGPRPLHHVGAGERYLPGQRLGGRAR